MPTSDIKKGRPRTAKKVKAKSVKTTARGEPDVATKTERQPKQGSTYLGVCYTCNAAPNCVQRERSGDRPIWFCENFDNEVSPGTSYEETAVYPRPIESPTSPGVVEVTEFKGLCINCDNREVCRHAKQEGGIWHCEEYQ